MNKPKTSTLLTITGIGLGILTNFIVAKRTSLAIEKLKEAKPEDGALSKKEKTKVLTKAYLPAIGTGAMATACIIASRKIDTKQIALLGGSLVVANKKIKNIESEMDKFLGKEKTKAIKNKVNSMIANDIFDSKQNEKLKKKALKSDEFIFVDSVTGSTFISTVEKVENAEIELSEVYNRDKMAAWVDLEYLATGNGLWAKGQYGEYLGWSREMYDQFYGANDGDVDIDNLTFKNTPICDENGEVQYYYIEPSLIPEYGYFEY